MGKRDRQYVMDLLKKGGKLPRPWADPDPTRITKVDCTDCHACCHQVVPLTENDNPSLYMTEKLVTDKGEIIEILMHRPDGSCIYLGRLGCTIYGKHPEVCRSFSCADLLKILDPHYIAELERDGDDQDCLMVASGRRNAAASENQS